MLDIDNKTFNWMNKKVEDYCGFSTAMALMQKLPPVKNNAIALTIASTAGTYSTVQSYKVSFDILNKLEPGDQDKRNDVIWNNIVKGAAKDIVMAVLLSMPAVTKSIDKVYYLMRDRIVNEKTW